jgi:hypothetical protein
MNIDQIITVFGAILAALAMICFIPFLTLVVFPFFQSFSPEHKIENFVNKHCLQGNEIAILIKRERLSYYSERDHTLIRAAIEGNENAIRALKLDSAIRKNKDQQSEN